MTRRTVRVMTPARLLARKLSQNELEMKNRLVAARINAGMSVEDVATKLGVDPDVIADLEASDKDMSLSELRHYAYAVNALIHFGVVEDWTSKVLAPSRIGESESLYTGDVAHTEGLWSWATSATDAFLDFDVAVETLVVKKVKNTGDGNRFRVWTGSQEIDANA